jgi:O-acetylserine/cysteine efflux transporter
MSVIPPLPMFALSLLTEGPERIGESLATAFTPEALPALIGLVYTAVLGTVVGTGIWTGLMKRNPSSRVAPFSMLVPVVGFTTAWLVLGEVPRPGDLVGGAIVIAGVFIATVAWRPRRRMPADLDAEESPNATAG